MKVLYHIRAWRPYWSCDRNTLNKRLSPGPMDVPHLIWLLPGQTDLEKTLKYNDYIHVYNTGSGADYIPGVRSFIQIKIFGHYGHFDLHEK